MPTPQTPSLLHSPDAGAAVTSDELRSMLVRFTVALNRRRAYAAEHPMVRQSEDALFESLRGLLKQRPIVTIGVAHRELLVDQEPVTHGGATARELAERLHRRGVGGLTLQAGLSRDAIRQALAWLAQEPAPGKAGPAGAPQARSEEPPPLVGVTIAKVAYERLALTDEQAAVEADVAALWRALAAVAFEEDAPDGLAGGASPATGHTIPASATDAKPPTTNAAADTTTAPAADADATAETPSAERVADAITARTHDRRFARRVGFVIHTIAAQLRTASPEARREIAQRLCVVLQRLGESSLAAIIRAAGTAAEQRRYIATLIDMLPVTAIVEWLEQTARATDQQLSHHLVRLLTKLAAHDGERRASTGDARSQFRATAQALVADWGLDDPNPIAHGALLDHIATRATPQPPPPGSAAPAREEITEDEREAPDEDAVRLVQMACEIDVAGPDAIAAAQELVAAGHTVQLFTWLASAPGQAAAATLRQAVVAPEGLRRTLLREPFDASSARALLEGVDVSLAPILLDLLAEARVRSARRVLLNTLRDFGAPLTPLLLARLETGPAWYVVRNLLLLLRDVAADVDSDSGRLASGTLLGFLDHAQEQVRIEALRLLVESVATRETAIRRALDDRSPRIVAAAIEALPDAGAAARERPGGVPPLSRDIALRLMRLADDKEAEPDVRARAVRALAGTTGPTVRDWLVTHVHRRTRFLRRRSLAEGPTILPALELLAGRYADDPLVVPVLALARARDARDPRRLAVERTAPGVRP